VPGLAAIDEKLRRFTLSWSHPTAWDEIAQLLSSGLQTVVGRFKVFMIDEVHMLTNTAFNAMLKTGRAA
jgi:DNA polymerase III delta prime subunit